MAQDRREALATAVHPLAIEVAATYLSLVDAALPGFVEGLYLTGSVALGDFRPAESDIDFVAVSSSPARPQQLRALELVHEQLARRHPKPFFDGPYLTWSDLAGDPYDALPGPSASGLLLQPDSTEGRDPVAWRLLAGYGVPLRGPLPQHLAIPAERADLRSWCRANLGDYWRPWHERGTRGTTPAGLAMLGTWAPAWGVLGVSRIHHTIATGEIISKSQAAAHARTAFDPRWHRITDECLRIRRSTATRSLYTSPFARRAEALAFIDMAISTSLALR
ncbi:hypothetical protein GCM10027589_40790 [Actinocorallia lasiicapitis]